MELVLTLTFDLLSRRTDSVTWCCLHTVSFCLWTHSNCQKSRGPWCIGQAVSHAMWWEVEVGCIMLFIMWFVWCSVSRSSFHHQTQWSSTWKLSHLKSSNLIHFFILILMQRWVCSRFIGAVLFIPKRQKVTFTDFYIKCSFLVEWPAQLNPSSWILSHLQESAKTRLFHLYLTL